MLCELCNRNEASGVLHRKDANGDDEELYVCKECLSENSPDAKDRKSSRKIKSTIITSDGSEPPAFVKNFLAAAVGLIEGVTDGESAKKRKCPVCGSTWEKIKDAQTVGCADCWIMFGREIRETFLSGAYGQRHRGMIPEKDSDGKPSRAFLEKELKDAVDRQNYRKAARIRKQLDELDGGEKHGGNGGAA